MKTKLCILLAIIWFSICIKAQPTLTLSSSNPVICAGESVTLTVATPILYNWCYWAPGSSSSSKTIAIHPDSDTLVVVECFDVSANKLVASFTQTVFICTNIRDIEFTETVFLYPNPSTGTLKLIGLSARTPVRVYDTFGKLCLETKAEEGITELNLSDKPQGIYFVNFEYKNQMLLRKISLE